MRDFYGREINYLRLSVTELCNLRCRYCMPEEGICKKHHAQMLTEEEMIRAVTVAASLGIHKLRITGGEPLIKPNILSICARAAAVEGMQEICLTTNGVLLDRLAKPLAAAGVKRINLSLDTLDREKYAQITRIGRLEDALRGLEAALDAGFEKVKINVVLIGGLNDDEIVRLAELTRYYPVDVRFIELMPMQEDSDFGAEAYLPVSAVVEQLPELEPQCQDGGVAKLYRLPGAKGNLGLISPLSAHFCGQCNRLRLTADGNLKPCLHDGQEWNIRGMNWMQMRTQFQRAIRSKPACHGALSAYSMSMAGRNMNQIGG